MATKAITNTNTGPMSSVALLEGKRILQYPTGLGSTAQDKYGKDQHYIIFRINTDDKTTALRDDKVTGAVMVAAGTRQGIGIGAAPRLNFLLKTDDRDMRIKYGDKVVDDQDWLMQKGMTRLDKVVVLPMPAEHNVSTSMTYGIQDQNGLTRLGDAMNNGVGETIGAAWTKGKNKLFAKIIGSGTSEAALLYEERQVANPKKEVIFDNITFRNFPFRFEFAPRTEKESEMVKDIIETFRYYALPEINKAKAYYILPSEFEITFMIGNVENPHIPRITTSVLKNISVNYSPNSVWSTLPNGAPLSIVMSLEFQELEIVDRSRVFNSKQPITSGY